MLKLHYSDSGLFMEPVADSLENWLNQRVLFSARVGQNLYVSPSQASFLLPAAVMPLTELELMLWLERATDIHVCPVDVDFVEVSVQGTWVAESAQAHEGTLLMTASESVEALLYRLWQTSQVPAASKM